MSHEEGSMAEMKNPAESLGESIGRIDNTGNMAEDDVAHGSPMLKGKRADLNVARTFRRTTVVDDLDAGVIIFPNIGSCKLAKAEFLENKTNVLGDFRGSVGSDEFSFGRALSTDRLGGGAIGDGGTSDATGITSGGAALA